jgi:hypothetical protein
MGFRWCVRERRSLGACACRTTGTLAPGAVEAPADRETATRASDGARPERRWYGWQFLIVDGASLALAVSTLGTGSVVQIGLGTTGFAFGAPIVHWAHGHLGRGFGSLGLRLGLPLAATGISLLLGDNFATLFALVLLFPTAVAAAITLDAAVLAYDSVPTSTTAPRVAGGPPPRHPPAGLTPGAPGCFCK